MTECMKAWHTPTWDYDLMCVMQREHVCILGLGHVGNHRDAGGNVRVRFEE